MGIFSLFPWIKEYYPECIINRDIDRLEEITNGSSKVLSLSIDLNQVFHNEAQRVLLYGEFEGTDPRRYSELKQMTADQRDLLVFEAIATYLDTQITRINPLIATFLCVDGPSAIAKSNQAKNRRFKGAVGAKNGSEEEKISNDDIEISREGEQLFNPIVITPGTVFMQKLSVYLQKWIEQNKDTFSEIVIFSSHLNPGEGEHKITRLLRSIQFHQDRLQKRYPRKNLLHVVFGGDADLVVIGLGLELERYIILTELRFFPERIKEKHAKGYPKRIEDMTNFYRLVDITMLRRKISEQLNGNIDDFTLLSVFVGNDFLPAIISISIKEDGMNILFDIYKRAGYPKMIENGRVNFDNLYKFLKLYAEEEPRLLENLIPFADKYHAEILKQTSRKVTQVQASKFKSGYSFDYKKFRELHYQGIFNDIEFDIPDICEKWLGSLSWFGGYYREGITGCNPGWFYNYYNTPLIADVVEVLEKHLGISTEENSDAEVFEEGKEVKSPDIEKERLMKELKVPSITKILSFEWEATVLREPILTPFEQQVAVIPVKYANILPKDLRILLTNPKSPIGDLSPIKFKIDMQWKEKLYQGVALIPFIDQYRISTAVKCIPLDDKTNRRNKREANRQWINNG